MIDNKDQDRTEVDTQSKDNDIAREENPCASCEEESLGCDGCGQKKNRANTYWYVIAVIVILLIALLLRSAGGT
ncbi:MAG TPA: hypothetical protein VFD19_05185 [Clostridia bacterium]|nr:hypothetical protein [Clostridia bacterium]